MSSNAFSPIKLRQVFFGERDVKASPSEFRVMDRTGDGLKLTWNADNANEVKAAKEAFDLYKSRGYDLFRLGEDDARGGKLTEFDPHALGILAVPRMRGG